MPQPAEVLAAERELARAYAQAWRQIEHEIRSLKKEPTRANRVVRLTQMQRRIEKILRGLEGETRRWLSNAFPKIYAAALSGTVADAGWSVVHQSAVKSLVNEVWDDLLAATTHVSTDVKILVRAIARDSALQKVIEGKPAKAAGRELARILRRNEVSAIVYSNGAKRTLADYGEMVIRSATARGYNIGSLLDARSHGVEWMEILDGPECGLDGHDTGDIANGMIVDTQFAMAHLISHPNCRRTFASRPDLETREQALKAGATI